MRVVENLQGSGRVTNLAGIDYRAEYCLEILQQDWVVRSQDQEEGQIVPGLKTILGQVEPALFLGEEGLLELEDGRKLRFFFKNSRGEIGFMGFAH